MDAPSHRTGHPWHTVPLPDEPTDGELPVVVEIPQGEKNKYEVDKATGLLRLDRVLYSSVHYPHNYGFFPRTLGDDGDALDALVLGQTAIAPLTIVTTRLIGGFRMRDEAGNDEKMVCVPLHDPAFAQYRAMAELPDHVVRETLDFFEQYKRLEGKDVDVGEQLGRDESLAVVSAAIARYRERFPPDRA